MKKVLALVFAIHLLRAELPPPYHAVELLPFNPQGWYMNSSSMEWLIRRGNVKVVIEVGSWLGLSTRHIAKTLPENGVVYAVDHWLGSPNEDNSFMDISTLYAGFLSNVIHENLTHKIIPVKMTSLEASTYLKHVTPDLVYIDATHEFNSVLQDLILWFPFVKGHGVLCGDDYYWGTPGNFPVKQAVDVFANGNNLTVQNDGWLWYLEERN